MAISLRGSITNTANAANVLTLDMTSVSGQENDFLIQAVIGGTPIDWQDESGWTRIGVGHPDIVGAVFYRLAPSSYTSTGFNLDANQDTAGIGAAFSGVDTTNPLQVLTTHDEQTPTTSPDNKPVICFQTAAWAVAVLMTDDDDIPADPKPSGYTLVAVSENSNVNQCGVAMAYKSLSGTAPFTEAAGVWTLDASEEFSTTMMIISESPFSLSSGGGSRNPLAGPISIGQSYQR